MALAPAHLLGPRVRRSPQCESGRLLLSRSRRAVAQAHKLWGMLFCGGAPYVPRDMHWRVSIWEQRWFVSQRRTKSRRGLGSTSSALDLAYAQGALHTLGLSYSLDLEYRTPMAKCSTSAGIVLPSSIPHIPPYRLAVDSFPG